MEETNDSKATGPSDDDATGAEEVEPDDAAEDAAAEEWLRSLSDPGNNLFRSPALRQEHLPPLDRVRPDRRPLIPKRVWVVGGIAIISIAVIAAAVTLALGYSTISAPDVVGLDIGVAKADLSRVGLGVIVASERFSDQPEGRILEQSPRAGSDVKRGGDIEVVISGGTDEFTLPDVIGDGVSLATGALESLGLVVKTELVVSENTSDTVLSTTPSPGSTVRTGDVVTIQVSAARTDGGTLEPFRMDGVAVNIDPAPFTIGSTDPTFEVARRLRSLLEASGAVVKVLRSADASTATEADRALAAADSSASVSIGLSVASSGAAGRLVASPTSMTAPVGPASESLAVLIADKLTPVAPPVSRVYAQADSVLGMSSAPWVRVTLGSAGVRADETAFADPAWADSVARAVYSAIGELHGQRVAP